jgi:hypothetical protein
MCPYPLRRQITHEIHVPLLEHGSSRGVFNLENECRNVRAGDLGVGCIDDVFISPPHRGFRIALNLTDHKCRIHTAEPPTVRGMERLHGYQRPPLGGGGECRRACERSPLKGRRRRRCAAGGRHLSSPYPIEFVAHFWLENRVVGIRALLYVRD